MTMKYLLVPGLLVIALCIFIRPSEAQKPKPKDCTGCDQVWLKSLKAFNKAGKLSLEKYGSLCVFARKMELFTPCPLPPGTKCPTLEKVKFTCCPKNCVSTIMACHIAKPLNPVNDICIPTDLTPWMTNITRIVAENMRTKPKTG